MKIHLNITKDQARPVAHVSFYILLYPFHNRAFFTVNGC
jgi:hypothetical protein